MDEVKSIGMYKTKRKYLSFVSGIGNARIKRNTAYVDGRHISGMYDGINLKISLRDDNTVDISEVDSSKEVSIESVIETMDNMEVLAYVGTYVLNNLPFKDEDGLSCYLEVEHNKPINQLAELVAESKKTHEISDHARNFIAMYMEENGSVDSEEEVSTEEEVVEEEVVEEEVETKQEEVTTANVDNSYINSMFEEMKSNKISELKEKIRISEDKIIKYRSERNQSESNLNNETSNLELLKTRLKTMDTIPESNGFAFYIGSEIGAEFDEINENTVEIVNRIAKVVKFDPKRILKAITLGEYQIIFKKIHETEENSFKLLYDAVKRIDPLGNFNQISKVDDLITISYKGELTRPELLENLIRLGFERDADFDKLMEGDIRYENQNPSSTNIIEVKGEAKITLDEGFDIEIETKEENAVEIPNLDWILASREYSYKYLTLEDSLEAIRENGYNLRFVKHQTPEMCIEAIRQNGYALQHVRNQTEWMCLEAIKQIGNDYSSIHLGIKITIKNRGLRNRINSSYKFFTEEESLKAVKENGLNLAYVKHQTPEICLEAVKQNGLALKYVINQTEEICIEAHRQNPESMFDINIREKVTLPKESKFKALLKRIFKF